jgi:hypothetical protein
MMKVNFVLLLIFLFSAGRLMGDEAEIMSNIRGKEYWIAVAKVPRIYCIDTSLFSEIEWNALEKRKYYEFIFPVTRILRGEECDDIKLLMWIDEEKVEYFMSLVSNKTKETIVFLVSETPFMLAFSSARMSMLPYSEETFNDILEQMKFQEMVLREKLYANFSIDEGMKEKVAGIIAGLAASRAQEAVFELEELGAEAVPYIILLLENYARIPGPGLSFKLTYPEAWEGRDHRRPKRIIDALVDILPNSAHVYIYFDYNWANDEEQKLACWRMYLYYNYVLNGYRGWWNY